MAGFATVDAIVNAWSVNRKGQKLFFQKTLPTTTVANVPHTLWDSTGMPTAGANPTVGAANGRVLLGGNNGSPTTGCMPYADATAPATMHLISLGAQCVTASGTGSLILVDRVADINLSIVQATTALTGVTATSRLNASTAPGDGCQIWAEVTTALSAAANTFTLTYTNQLGTGSKVTPTLTTVASAVRGRSPFANTLWTPLAAGDTGVRSIDNWTFGAGSATGNINLALVRPLATIPLVTVAQYVERDFVVEIPNLEKLFDDSVLSFIWLPTAAATPTFFGEVRIASN